MGGRREEGRKEVMKKEGGDVFTSQLYIIPQSCY